MSSPRYSQKKVGILRIWGSLGTDAVEGDAESNNVVAQVRRERPSRRGSQPRRAGMPGASLQHAAWRRAHFDDLRVAAVRRRVWMKPVGAPFENVTRHLSAAPRRVSHRQV